ncbi:MAG: phosphodiesterase [Betaproteobacteria bacterium]|nr:phosphodiesterase [Betaproteobacteria bacterium]
MRLPDYNGGSLLNLIASLAAARGARARHPTLSALPPDRLVSARNLVFLLVDGLGYNYLTDVGRGGALCEHLAGKLTSVFPSTTASAITTSFTGRSPHEHGLTGWFTWFSAVDTIAAPLPFRRRGDDKRLTDLGIRPAQLFDDTPSILDAMDCRRIVVSQRRIVDSDYSRHFGGGSERRGYDHLTELVGAVVAAVRSGPERKYIYAYYPEFDSVAHKHGVGSAQAAMRLQAIDAAFAELLRRLSGTDTALVVSADHGFIDTPAHEALELERYPELAGMLVRPLSGEPRVAFCHVRPGLAGSFMAKARDMLNEYMDVLPSSRLVEEGWFGPGVAHRCLAERVGDVALVMKRHAIIKDHLPGEKRHTLIGNHGGITEDEMLIPLVFARL